MKTLVVGMFALAFAAGCAEEVQIGARIRAPQSAPTAAAAPDAATAYRAGAEARRSRRAKRRAAYAALESGNKQALANCAAGAKRAERDPKTECACVRDAIAEGRPADEVCEGYDPEQAAQAEADEDASYGSPSAASATAQGYYLGLVGPRPRNFDASSWIHVNPALVPGEDVRGDGVRTPACDGLEIALNGTLVLWASSAGPASRPMRIPVPTGMGVPLARGDRNADMTSVLPASLDGWVDVATMKVGANLTVVAPPAEVVPSVRCWKRADRVVTAGGPAVPVTVWHLRAEMRDGGTWTLGKERHEVDANGFDWYGKRFTSGPLAGL